MASTENQQVQPHDEDPCLQSRKDNHFVPPHFYCVETICAPCGAVHAWTLFDKPEFPEFPECSISNT